MIINLDYRVKLKSIIVNFENRAARFQQIYRHITQMAIGDFSSRLPFTGEKDQLETIVLLLNMLTEELSVMFHGQETETLRNNLIGANFLLDKNQIVIFANIDFNGILKTQNKKSLIGTNFLDLLTLESRSVYTNALKSIAKNTQEIIVPIKFRYSKNSISNCKLCRIPGLPLTILHINFKRIDEAHNVAVKLYLKKDIQKIRTIKEYIVTNFNKDLPGLKEMAQIVHTNEHKLKYGFKQLYGTTIFRFQSHIRLKQAKILIENTAMPIKQIQNQLGYKSAAHFSRTFKKDFGYSPKKYRKLHS